MATTVGTLYAEVRAFRATWPGHRMCEQPSQERGPIRRARRGPRGIHPRRMARPLGWRPHRRRTRTMRGRLELGSRRLVAFEEIH